MLSFRIAAVDQELIQSECTFCCCVSVLSLSSLQCCDTIGLVSGRTSGLCRQSPNILCWNKWQKNEWNWLTQVRLEMAVGSCVWFTRFMWLVALYKCFYLLTCTVIWQHWREISLITVGLLVVSGAIVWNQCMLWHFQDANQTRNIALVAVELNFTKQALNQATSNVTDSVQVRLSCMSSFRKFITPVWIL